MEFIDKRIMSPIRDIWRLKVLGIEVMMHTEGLGLVEVTGVSRDVIRVRISPVEHLGGGGLSVLIAISFWFWSPYWRGGWRIDAHTRNT